MSNIDNEAVQIPATFWHHLEDQEWDEAVELLSDEFDGFIPQTNETILGPIDFVNWLRLKLGPGKSTINNRMASYDVWDKTHEVALQILVTSDGQANERHNGDYFIVAFFTVDRDYLISGATMYYAAKTLLIDSLSDIGINVE